VRTARVLSSLLALSLAVLPQTGAQQKSIDQRIEELEQEIRELKRQRELEREEAAIIKADEKVLFTRMQISF
jgi:hypothetical protein